MNLGNYSEYTENRLKVKLLTSSAGKLMESSFFHVLVTNDGDVITLDDGKILLASSNTYSSVRTSPDSYYTVTPISKPKSFSIVCVPVNSNP